MLKYHSLYKNLYRRVVQAWSGASKSQAGRWLAGLPVIQRTMVAVAPLAFAWVVVTIIGFSHQYSLSAQQRKLLTKPYVTGSKITETAKGYSYNQSDSNAKKTGAGHTQEMVLAAAKTDTSGKAPYQATLPKNLNDGIKFASSTGDLAFTMTPKQSTADGQLKDGYLVYPGGSASQHVYTFKRNGLKEDIILSSAPGDTATYSWALGLGKNLEARLMPDGGVGFYSADQTLYGNLTVGDAKSQALIDNAKQKSAKTNLAFVIPRPFSIDSHGKTDYANLKFSLSGDQLKLTATKLRSRAYPLTLDPTVVVTTTGDFTTANLDDGSIDYSSAGQISRAAAPTGTSGWSAGSSFTTARGYHGSVAYNGYLYILGGWNASTGLNDDQYAQINSNGTIGAWTTTSSFTTPRYGHSAVAYNGNMYILGGYDSTTYYSDTQYAPINSNGTLGAWTATTSFSGGRESLVALEYNGYMYVSGGYGGSQLNDVQYAPINSNGTIGTWTATSSFATGRNGHGFAAYNGYMYVFGGSAGASLFDTQYATINADGSVGAWNTTTVQTTGRRIMAGGIFNGYLYATGGYNGSTYYDTVSYARLNADGTVGTWLNTSVAMPTGRYSHGMVLYKGFMYVTGGINNTTYYNDTQIAPISSNGNISSAWTTATSNFTTGRAWSSTVASNGYIYLIGGSTGSIFTDVQFARIQGDGSIGTWSATTSLPVPRTGAGAFVSGGYIYMLGGQWSTSAGLQDLATTISAPININGTLGAWTAQTTMTSYHGYGSFTTYNGYAYASNGDASWVTGTTTTEYAQILAGGKLGTWASTTTPYGVPYHYMSMVAYNGYMYVLGGTFYNSPYTDVSTVRYAPINGNGTLGTWNSTTSLPATRNAFGAVINNGYLYVMTGNVASTASSNVMFTTFNGNGTLNSWTSTGGSNFARYASAGMVYNGTLYLTAGYNTAYSTDVQYVTPNSDGTITVPPLGSWTGSLNSLASPLAGHASVAINGYLYVIGGCCYQSAVQYAPINADGTLGAWAATSSLGTARAYLTAATFGGYMYALGGETAGSTYTNSVEYAPINADGTLGSWATTASFSTARANAATTIYNGYLYEIGGNGGSNLADVQYAPMNANGTLGSWSSTTSFTTARQMLTATAYNGYLYILGGYNGSGLTDVRSAPLNTNGTIGSWTAQTSLPAGRWGSAIIGLNGYIYLIAGKTGASTYASDTLVNTFGSSGTLGSTWSPSGYSLSGGRFQFGAASDGSSVYTVGGTGSGGPLADVQVAKLSPAPFKASYDRLIDIGYNASVSGLSYSGTAPCGLKLSYRSAPNAGGVLTAATTLPNLMPGATVALSATGTRYLWVHVGLDDSTCGTTSTITDVNLAYQLEPPPAPAINMAGTLPAAPSLRNFATSWASSASPTITMPAGTMAGDGLYIVTSGGWNPPASAPLGWTLVNRQIGFNFNWGVYYKVAAGVTGSVSSDAGTVVTLSYTGGTFDTETAIYDVADSNVVPTINYVQTNTSVAATVNATATTDDLFLYFGAARTASSNTVTLSSGTTDQTRSADTNTGLVVGHESPAAGPVAQTFTPSVTTGNGSNYLVLQLPRGYTPSTPVNQGITPTFQARTTQVNSTYLQYKFDICADSACSSILRTVDQTASQTGWTGQNQQTGTAYTGSTLFSASTVANHTYQAPALTTGTQYWYRGYAIDPASSNTWSAASPISTFTTASSPAAPVLSVPVDTSTGVNTRPEFRLSATDPESDYLQYKIQICTTSNCSSVLSTIDQTASQNGWVTQSQQSGTAYAGDPAASQIAIYQYQGTSLTASTQYWWRAYAIDPGGSNAFSPASTISTFTVTANASGTNSKLNLGGGTKIKGGTHLGQ